MLSSKGAPFSSKMLTWAHGSNIVKRQLFLGSVVAHGRGGVSTPWSSRCRECMQGRRTDCSKNWLCAAWGQCSDAPAMLQREERSPQKHPHSLYWLEGGVAPPSAESLSSYFMPDKYSIKGLGHPGQKLDVSFPHGCTSLKLVRHAMARENRP